MSWYNGRYFTNSGELEKYRKKVEAKKRLKEKYENENKGKQNGIRAWVCEEPVFDAYQGEINIVGD